MRAGPQSASTKSLVLGAVIGAMTYAGIIGASGLGLVSHTSCNLGVDIGSETIWTPYSLTNAPYLGTSHYTANFSLFETFGFTKVTASGYLDSGNISTGYFETQKWTLYEQSNGTFLGPGTNHRCDSRYAAMASAPIPDLSAQGLPLQGPGNMSNINEPTSYNDSGPLPSAEFLNGFYSANLPPVTTCGTPAKVLNVTSSSFEISITMSTIVGPVSTDVPIASWENFTYHFPANTGTWQVDNLSAPGGPGGGWAFNYTGPCM